MFIEIDAAESESFPIAIRSPLETLFLSHKQATQEILGIAEFLGRKDNHALSYFFSAASVHDRWAATLQLDRLFNAAQAIKALDADYWQRAILLTDVLDIMPAEKRNQWHESIRMHSTPAFDRDIVIDTLQDLILQREHFFCERVDGLFRNLSGVHVTNAPEGFSKRMIMDYLTCSLGYLNHERVAYIHDLRFVIAAFMGREQPSSALTRSLVDDIHRRKCFGQWHDFDGGAFRLKLYKKGTAHIEVHPDIAWKLNLLLAKLHPTAIPTRFRKSPTRTKAFDLAENFLSEQAIVDLNAMRIDQGGRKLAFPFRTTSDGPFNQKSREEAENVLESIGGVKLPNGEWAFDFNPVATLKEVVRMGTVPGKSFQYYATPTDLAQEAVDLCEVTDADDILEPSAGQGAIASLLPRPRLKCVEISALHCTVLRSKGFDVVEGDFLVLPPSPVSKIVMNPPFSGNRARLHVNHAAEHWLRPGGRLVAVLPASLRGHVFFKGWPHNYSEIRHNCFKGTGVSVVLLTLDKPL